VDVGGTAHRLWGALGARDRLRNVAVGALVSGPCVSGLSTIMFGWERFSWKHERKRSDDSTPNHPKFLCWALHRHTILDLSGIHAEFSDQSCAASECRRAIFIDTCPHTRSRTLERVKIVLKRQICHYTHIAGSERICLYYCHICYVCRLLFTTKE
jgi:hypothetical protein